MWDKASRGFMEVNGNFEALANTKRRLCRWYMTDKDSAECTINKIQGKS